MGTWDFSGKCAVVTGAASGIGAALARNLAARGTHLALVDLDAVGLERTRQAIQQNVRVSLHHMDVRDREAVEALPGAVATQHCVPADMLVNNAGVALEGAFANVSEADFDWVLDINLHAPIRMTRAFLPTLKERPAAQIVNISSVFGLIGPPGQAAYSTAKFGLRGFTEALQAEYRGSQLKISCVHPGGIATNIARRARTDGAAVAGTSEERDAQFRRLAKTTPATAASVILKGTAKGKPRILIGLDAWFAYLLTFLLPTRYHAITGRLPAENEGE